MGVGIDEGVRIQFHATQKEALEEPAHMLAGALAAEGISARQQFTSASMPTTNPTAIHVIVGSEPRKRGLGAGSHTGQSFGVWRGPLRATKPSACAVEPTLRPPVPR
jgi:hypothetical protein